MGWLFETVRPWSSNLNGTAWAATGTVFIATTASKNVLSLMCSAYSSATLLNGQSDRSRVLQRRISCARGGCRNGNGVGFRGLSEETPRAASGQPKNRGASEKCNEDAEECARHLGNI